MFLFSYFLQIFFIFVHILWNNENIIKNILFSSILQTCMFMNNIFNFLNMSQFIFRTFLHALCLHQNSMNSLLFLYIHIGKNRGVHLLYVVCVRCCELTLLFSNGNLKSILADQLITSCEAGFESTSKMSSCRAFSIRL